MDAGGHMFFDLSCRFSRLKRKGAPSVSPLCTPSYLFSGRCADNGDARLFPYIARLNETLSDILGGGKYGISDAV